MQIILFLLFMAAEKGVNRLAGRPLMNGASCYLVVATFFLLKHMFQIGPLFSAPDSDAYILGQLMGGTCCGFIFPMGVAVYYSQRFTRAKAAAEKKAVQSIP